MGCSPRLVVPGRGGGGRRGTAGAEETAMEREMEFLRQQIDYMERMLETCMARISSLEAQVAELERWPVAIVRSEEPEAAPRGAPSVWDELVFARSVTFWENKRRRER